MASSLLIPVILDRDLHNAWLDKFGVYLVNRDGTGLRQLVEEAGPQALYPALSPDGSEVLYTQKINGRLQILKVNVDSGVRVQLTHGGILFQANSGVIGLIQRMHCRYRHNRSC